MRTDGFPDGKPGFAPTRIPIERMTTVSVPPGAYGPHLQKRAARKALPIAAEMLCSKPSMTSSENPFSIERVMTLRFRFPAGFGWDSLLARLEAQNYCAAIVGQLGSGKTTLLDELAPRLEERGFQPVIFRLAGEASMREKERLPEKLRQIKNPSFILMDGAEQLSTRHWLPVRAAASQAAGFVITVHRTGFRRFLTARQMSSCSKRLSRN